MNYILNQPKDLPFNRETAYNALEMFLNCKVSSADDVFAHFCSIAQSQMFDYGGQDRFVYVPGSRPDRVLLVAHADTVWQGSNAEQAVCFEGGVFLSRNGITGTGADDRSGCAILWMLRSSGHSLLITDGEERGQRGAQALARNDELLREINAHSFMVEFDRRGKCDCKYYNIPVTDQFKEYIAMNTGFIEAGRSSSTDITTLCRSVCGVNLSTGYYNEHTADEFLVFDEWFNTLQTAARWLGESSIPRFEVKLYGC